MQMLIQVLFSFPHRLFGPKRKMTSAIARWHSSARPPSDALELAYADRLEAEMQELAIQLHKVGGRQGAGGYMQKWQERCLETHTCREGHSDRTVRAESMTGPTMKGRYAGRPAGRRPRKIWDIQWRSGRHPQERRERVRSENKRLAWAHRKGPKAGEAPR